LEAAGDQLLAATRLWEVITAWLPTIVLGPFAAVLADLFAVRVSTPPFLFLTTHSFLLTRPSISSTLLIEQ